MFMLLGDVAFLYMIMRSSRYLHSAMLSSVLRACMQFFESTPIGRILNRFSKDIDAVEFTVSSAYRSLLRLGFQVLITIILISIQTPFFLIPVVPIAIIYVFVEVSILSFITKYCR
jgi:ABC-type multidrug transport system fused ATPase/permease subunit